MSKHAALQNWLADRLPLNGELPMASESPRVMYDGRYLARAGAGGGGLQRERGGEDDLLTTARGRFARRAAEANVEIGLEIGATPPIEADLRRLEQALSNIVDNAVRHTPAGGKVTLSGAAANGGVPWKKLWPYSRSTCRRW